MALQVIHSCSSWLPQTMTWLFTQVRRLPRELARSHVVCGRTQNLDRFRVPDIRAASRIARTLLPSRGLCQLPLLRLACAEIEPEIVHSHFGNRGWWDRPVVSRTSARHVVTFYGYDLTMLPRKRPGWVKRYRNLFLSADLFLCEGPHMAGLVAARGCPETKIRVHHLGVDVHEIPFRPRSFESGGPLRVLMAGSFVEKKGFTYAIEALGKLSQSCDLEATIVGDAPGESRGQKEKRAILAAIDNHGLASSVRMLGYQPYDVLLREALAHHVFLSPSVRSRDGDTEGGAPVTLIDLSATGMPVVSTVHADIPNVILDEQSGLLAEERDVDGLVDRLKWLVEHPERWKAMGEAGRRQIEAEFDAAKQGGRLARHYQELCVS